MPLPKNRLQSLGAFVAVAALSAMLHAQPQYATPYTFTTLAGIASSGSADGTITAAQFASPAGLAADRAGDLFVADTNNNTIREILSSGSVTTFAGSASSGYGSPANGSSSTYADGPVTAARFLQPRGLAIDVSGNVYVADTGNDAIRKVSGGVVSTLAGLGTVTGAADGSGSAARFANPQGLAIDANGNLYVADTGNDTIRKVTPAGAVTTLAGVAGQAGSTDGTGSHALFNAPKGIAVDSSGTVYVADTGNNTIRKVLPSGATTTLAGAAGTSGALDASGSQARFNGPTALAFDVTGTLYVADENNNLVRAIAPGGAVSTVVDKQHAQPTALSSPDGLAVGSSGTLYVADAGDARIYAVTLTLPQGISVYAGGSGTSGSIDGTGSSARFLAPYAMTLGSDNNLHLVEYATGKLRQITRAGVVTTTGTVATKPFTTAPAFVSIAIGSTDDYYLTDYANAVVYHRTSSGSTSTIGDSNDYLAPSVFVHPSGIAVATDGSLLIADSGTNEIFKGSASGTPAVFAGAPAAGSADGSAANARFNAPWGVNTDAAGNLYVADTRNHVIRKVTPAGSVSTFAGSGTSGTLDGVASLAQFVAPICLTVDTAGNLFVFDQGAYTIRMIAASDGAVSTIAGLPAVAGDRDGTGPLALFNQVGSIAVDGQGNLYTSDGAEDVIKVGKLSAVLTTPVIYQQPAGASLSVGDTLNLSVIAGGQNLKYQWFFNGSAVAGGTGAAYQKTSVTAADAGSYTVTVSNAYGSVTSASAAVTVGSPSSSAGPTSGPSTTTSASGTTGRAGGGAPSLWWAGVLAALAFARARLRRTKVRL